MFALIYNACLVSSTLDWLLCHDICTNITWHRQAERQNRQTDRQTWHRLTDWLTQTIFTEGQIRYQSYWLFFFFYYTSMTTQVISGFLHVLLNTITLIRLSIYTDHMYMSYTQLRSVHHWLTLLTGGCGSLTSRSAPQPPTPATVGMSWRGRRHERVAWTGRGRDKLPLAQVRAHAVLSGTCTLLYVNPLPKYLTNGLMYICLLCHTSSHRI